MKPISRGSAGFEMSKTRNPAVKVFSRFWRAGFARLAPLNLTFEAWLYHPQLMELADLARAFPQTTIILNHVGGPLGIGPYADKKEETFAIWKAGIAEVGKCQNVVVKLGGLGMLFGMFDFHTRETPPSSEELARAYKPYIETCIAAFGPDRGMFESNFPPDGVSSSYAVLWNAFKRLTSGYSADEKAKLFSGTAKRVYRLT
jgi:predicted TIM-barrel fold metal-dependent hydrolase